MNPVVSAVIREVMKQIIHVIDQAGKIPGSICVELARDIGKSIDERNEISRGLKKRTDSKNANRAEVAKLLNKGEDRIVHDELLRYELWKDQSGLCPYCGKPLPLSRDCIQGNLTQVDHILPRSRSYDNSYDNKVLVHVECNQDKGSQTPAEWLGAVQNSERWRLLKATLQHMPQVKPYKKKRYLLNETFGKSEEDDRKFISRNLNDTRYITKLILEYLKDIYRLAGEDPDAKGSKRRIFAQSGALTALVRRGWGLEDFKKDAEGKRSTDQHHAVDALVCACLSEGQRQWITRLDQHHKNKNFSQTLNALSKSYKQMESHNTGRETPLRLKEPWGNMRNDVQYVLDQMLVSRRENRKGKGTLHNETYYQVVENDDGKKIYYSRKNLVTKENGKKIALLKNRKDLQEIKGINDPRNQWLREALEKWVDSGSPTEEEQLPRSPNGTIIRKIIKNMGNLSGRETPHGYVISGNMICIDVFSKINPRKPKEKIYFLVPIYSYHLKNEQPPMQAITGGKDEEDWRIIDESFEFEFTLWPNSLFEAKKKPTKKKSSGEYIIGYYRGINRDTAKIAARAVNNATQKIACSVQQGCEFFRKLNIDRLGQVSIVKKEKRVWRGKVCT